jgi:hypothetical protein
VPGQASVSKLSIIVPQVPRGARPWEVSPGDVRGAEFERTVGGTKVTLREFGLTTAIVFTADMNLIVRFQEQARSLRQLAAQWTYDLAVQQTEKVLKIERELEQAGHVLPDGGQLLQDAQNRLRLAKEHWDNRFFAEAYLESQRAMRPVRMLMRAQWDRAVKGLDTPTASPYAVSFYTLPEHWRFVERIRATAPAANVLPGGNFETVPTQTQQSWSLHDITLDEVEMRAERVKSFEFKGVVPAKAPAPAAKGPDAKGPAPKAKDVPTTVKVEPKEGKQFVLLQVKPRDPTKPPGSLAQVSGWVYLPAALKGSADGALLYDSAGGEPLAVRLTEPTADWQKFTLYRKVPASGEIGVTLALTGVGMVFFDDVRIEPRLETGGDTVLRAPTGGVASRQ